MTLRSILRSRAFAVATALLAFVLVVGGIVFFYYLYPALRFGPAQPIPFSHRVHVTTKEIDCRFCHFSVARTAFAGMPSANKCLYCHTYIIPQHPQIVRLTRYAEQDVPVPWRKVVWLPDHVWFSHQRHVLSNLSCTDCHGAIATMDRVRDLTRKNMGFCITCHRARHAPEDCWACHK